MIIFFHIFIAGLVGSNYPMNGEANAPALSFHSHNLNSFAMNQKEIWKNVVGFDNYMVSSIGRVKSKERISPHMFGTAKRKSVILKPFVDKKRGYPMITIFKNGNRYLKSAHRLVAKAFIPNPENKPQVNHINSIRHDNRVENLEWATASENILHGCRFGNITPPTSWKGKFGKLHHASKTILQMTDDGTLIAEFIGICNASRITGVGQSNISNCCIGKKKHAGGYVWKYKS